VPEELYPEIAANDAQREEWKRLFAIDEIEENITQPGYSEPLTVDFLKANPHLVLDTMFFGHDFKDRLLASIEDLDEQTDGLLVESENFQALNLLQGRYREQVKCIYIDPPYNTGGDGFIYKDSYQHSSWLSMMDDRLRLGREVLKGTERSSSAWMTMKYITRACCWTEYLAQKTSSHKSNGKSVIRGATTLIPLLP